MIKLLVPNMPTTLGLQRYLRTIDDRRSYTNGGVLVRLLTAKLEKKYDARVVVVSSGTAGLELAWAREQMKTLGVAEKVLLPALTFPASALAPHRAGWGVDFCDVDPETWIAPGVSGFGLPSCGMNLDAAGAFGEQSVGRGTAIFSLHATKVLGCGEGGFIVTHDQDAAYDYESMRNFGIVDGVSQMWGTNAKMSEYHAAVALAALDLYNRYPWLQLYDWYEDMLPSCVVKQLRPRGVYPMIAVKLPNAVEPVMKAMSEAGIETRRWYYPPLYRHPLFKSDPLPVTEDLARHLLGLPWHLSLIKSDVEQVCETLEKAVNGT